MTDQDTEVALLASIRWKNGVRDEDVLSTIRSTRRFVDFDGTIADELTGVRRELLCRVPLMTFLAEEPFVVQTWNSRGALAFFEFHTDLPRPRLVIKPPSRFKGEMPAAEGEVSWLAGSATIKDFEALGFTGKIIIDDWAAINRIHAPGCTIVHPDHPLP